MESSIINARVPQAKKDTAVSILDSMGLTVTDLINGAVDYLIDTGEVPSQKTQRARKRSAADYRSFAKRATLHIDWPADDMRSYKQMLADELTADYESLNSNQPALDAKPAKEVL